MDFNSNSSWQAYHPDRRQQERRQGGDRREMIRFEPDKTDRRRGRDRRQQGHDGWGQGEPI